MPFKVVLFFENSANGWAETYYASTSDPNVADGAAVALLSQRRRLLGFPSNVVAYRISDEANPRASSLTPVAPFNPGIYSTRADNPQTAAMMRLYSSSQTRTRALYLRGSPDNAYDTQFPDNADAQIWKTEFQVLGQMLRNQGPTTAGVAWLIKYRPRPSNVNKIPITKWEAQLTGSENTKVTAPGVTSLQGDYVDTYKVRGLPFAPGQCLVAFTALPGEIYLRYRTPADYTYPGGGYLVQYAAGYDSIDSYANAPRWTRRATGRPSDVSRGRRRAIAR